MTHITVKPPEVLYKLALSLAIPLQYQKLEKSGGMKLELLILRRSLKKSYGKRLTMNTQIFKAGKAFIAQTQEMEPNRPRFALL